MESSLSFQLSFVDPLLIEKEFIFDIYFGERGKRIMVGEEVIAPSLTLFFPSSCRIYLC